MISFCSFEESNLILEADGFLVLLPTAEASDAADTEVVGPKKEEEELGIYQVLQRLEEATTMLTTSQVRDLNLVSYIL